MHEYLGEMNELLRRYGAITVGELPCTPETERVLRYVSAKDGQLNMVFQFDIVDVGLGRLHKYDTVPKNWRLPDLKGAVDRTQALIRGTDGWSTVFMENHDQARSISRFADDSPQHRVASGKLLALLQATLSGTMYVYQGQEIGQVNAPLDLYPVTQYKDIDSLLFLDHLAEESDAALKQEKLRSAAAALQYLARDHARIPMVWDGSKPHGGFSDGPEPWMVAHPLAREINVADQLKDERSVLVNWRSMLALRREHADLFVHGHFDLLDREDPDLFTYAKSSTRGGKALVVLNFTGFPKEWKPPAGISLGVNSPTGPRLALVASTVDGKSSADLLAPYEGRVYVVEV